MARILVVDDDKNIRMHLATYLRGLGHEADSAADGSAALAAVAQTAYDLVLSDVRMADGDGMALLRELRAGHAEAVVVLMTAYATVPQAVEAMRAGAYDYLVKPFSLDQLGLLLERVLEVRALRLENEGLRRAVGRQPLLASANPRMARVLETGRKAAASDATVLLTGESGTGKNVLASAIHQWSARRAAPFVTIACTTLAEHLLESELFGHVKGAFTGAWKDKPGRLEAAAGGTVFLDEVGDLMPDLQAKLLRFIEDRCFERVGGDHTIRVDTRLIAATNRDLEADTKSGRFRQDLFFRLSVVAIRLPSLRERPEDLPALTQHLLAKLCAQYQRPMADLAPEAQSALAAYDWPGNVRELVHALEHAVVLARQRVIGVEDLPDRLLVPAPAAPPATALSLEEIERAHIQRVLADSATLEEAAARLGINPTTLWRKRRRYGID